MTSPENQMTVQDARTVEYRALREEILSLFNRRTQILAMTSALVSALVVGGTYGGYPEPLFMASIIASLLWMEDQRLFWNIIRTSVYIECFIEKRTPGMRWEQIVRQCRPSPSRPVGRLRTLISPYCLLSLASILLALLMLFTPYLVYSREDNVLSNGPAILPRTILNGIFLFLASLLLQYSARLGRKGYKSEKKHWVEEFTRLSRDAKDTRTGGAESCSL